MTNQYNNNDKNINLLPPELRGREKKELAKAGKDAVKGVAFSRPAAQKQKPALKLKGADRLAGSKGPQLPLTTEARPVSGSGERPAESLGELKESFWRKFKIFRQRKKEAKARSKEEKFKHREKERELKMAFSKPPAAKPVKPMKALPGQKPLLVPEQARLKSAKPKGPSWRDQLRQYFLLRRKRRLQQTLQKRVIRQEAAERQKKEKKFLKLKKIPAPRMENGKPAVAAAKAGAPHKIKRPVSPKENMLEVNLMPKEAALPLKSFPGYRIFIVLKAVLLAVLILAAAGLGVNWQAVKNLRSLNELALRQRQVDNNIQAQQAEFQQALSLQKRTAAAKQLLAKHVFWTKFFEILEDYTVEGVYYDNLYGTADGRVVLNAVATNYNNLAEQLAALWQIDGVRGVQIDSARLINTDQTESRGVRCEIVLTLDKNILNSSSI